MVCILKSILYGNDKKLGKSELKCEREKGKEKLIRDRNVGSHPLI